MPKHRVIGGVVVTTPEGVFANHRPAAHLMPAEVWEIVRPVAITASRAADYVSVASAHTAWALWPTSWRGLTARGSLSPWRASSCPTTWSDTARRR